VLSGGNDEPTHPSVYIKEGVTVVISDTIIGTLTGEPDDHLAINKSTIARIDTYRAQVTLNNPSATRVKNYEGELNNSTVIGNTASESGRGISSSGAVKPDDIFHE
jgi:hypothetical protein